MSSITTDPPHPSQQRGRVVIEATHLRRTAPGLPSQVLLHDASIALCAGDRLAVVGPSGAGKSVLLRLLASLDAPSSGSLTWQGQAVTRRNILAYRRAIAYVAQRPAMFDGSVEDNLRIPYTLAIYRDSRYDRAAVETLLKAAGRDAHFLDKSADQLSGGEAQITALIRVLQLRPAVLLLDEPTAALDPDSAATVEAMVDSWFRASPAAALAWISHNPSQAQRIGNRTLHMEAGRVQELGQERVQERGYQRGYEDKHE